MYIHGEDASDRDTQRQLHREAFQCFKPISRIYGIHHRSAQSSKLDDIEQNRPVVTESALYTTCLKRSITDFSKHVAESTL